MQNYSAITWEIGVFSIWIYRQWHSQVSCGKTFLLISLFFALQIFESGTKSSRNGNFDYHSDLNIEYICKVSEWENSSLYTAFTVVINFYGLIWKFVQKNRKKRCLPKYHLWHLIENVIRYGKRIWHWKWFWWCLGLKFNWNLTVNVT